MGYYYRPSLQCFDSEQYEITLDDNDFICIAPRADGRRCNWDISKEELEEAVQSKVNAMSLYPGHQRDYELQRMILARVCGDQHRQKLEAQPTCLAELVERYGQELNKPAYAQRPNTRHWTRSRSGTPRPSEGLTDYSGNIRHRYFLRPRRDGTPRSNPALSSLDARLSIFVPYPRNPRDLIDNVLRDSVPRRYATDGYVYAFTWPSHPGFVKIGYSKSPERRVQDLRDCFPGAKLLYDRPFDFPERIERLVHLQMSAKRHQIIICERCGSTHYEWFKVSNDEAIETIRDWHEVTEKEALYTSDGYFTESWQERAAQLTTEVTARGLLDLLDAEAKRKESERLDAQRRQQSSLVQQQLETIRSGIEELQRRTLETEQKMRLAEEAIEKKRQEQERERLEGERIERERLEKERLERERLEKERMERVRLEKERMERVRLEKERMERVRLEKERLERERLEKERLERERLETERLEAKRASDERLEGERQVKERSATQVSDIVPPVPDSLEKEFMELMRPSMKDITERVVAEALELAKDRPEAERLEIERREREEIEKLMLEQVRLKVGPMWKEHWTKRMEAVREEERQEKERLERARLEEERAKKERLEKERLEKEQAEALAKVASEKDTPTTLQLLPTVQQASVVLKSTTQYWDEMLSAFSDFMLALQDMEVHVEPPAKAQLTKAIGLPSLTSATLAIQAVSAG